jgi:hypothetical protein
MDYMVACNMLACIPYTVTYSTFLSFAIEHILIWYAILECNRMTTIDTFLNHARTTSRTMPLWMLDKSSDETIGNSISSDNSWHESIRVWPTIDRQGTAAVVVMTW